MVEQRTPSNLEFAAITRKQIMVRSPRRGRSKSIVVLDTRDVPRNFPIGRLNNYSKNLKKHLGPLSLHSNLESIDEVEISINQDSSNSVEFEMNRDYSSENLSQGKRYTKSVGQISDDANQKSCNNSLYGQIYTEQSMSAQSNKTVPDRYIEEKNKKNNLTFNYEAAQVENQKRVAEESKRLEPIKKWTRSQSVKPDSCSEEKNQLTIHVQNFGHGRRSNLVKKAAQMQRKSRAMTITMGDIDAHQLMLRSQLMIGEQDF